MKENRKINLCDGIDLVVDCSPFNEVIQLHFSSIFKANNVNATFNISLDEATRLATILLAEIDRGMYPCRECVDDKPCGKCRFNPCHNCEYYGGKYNGKNVCSSKGDCWVFSKGIIVKQWDIDDKADI